MGIEPTLPAWEAGILPLNYTRVNIYADVIISLRRTKDKVKIVYLYTLFVQILVAIPA